MIHLEPRHLDVVRRILETLVPEYEVLAFGSRVSGRNLKPFSDLDLVVMTDSPLPADRMAMLADAFSESDLPIKVDVVDWATTSDEFRRIIERECEVLQRASVTRTWHLVKIVADGEPLEIGGLNVWEHEWHSLPEQPIEVPHPSYPKQRHKMWPYQIEDKGKQVKFAAGEFSNCVWGFYVFT